MDPALEESEHAKAEGNVPAGSVIMCGGKIVARGCTRVTSDHDPTCHAVVDALRGACRNLDGRDLSGPSATP